MPFGTFCGLGAAVIVGALFLRSEIFGRSRRNVAVGADSPRNSEVANGARRYRLRPDSHRLSEVPLMSVATEIACASVNDAM